MSEGLLVVFVLSVFAVVFGGGISGIVAIVRGNASRRRIVALEKRLAALERSGIQPGAESPAEAAGEPAPAASKPPPAKIVTPSSADALAKEVAASIAGVPPSKQVGDPASPAGPPPLPPIDARPAPPPPPDRKSLELNLGGKWLGWVGAIMFIVSIGIGLGTIYDQLTPMFRLAIGIALGIASIGASPQIKHCGLWARTVGTSLRVFSPSIRKRAPFH